MSSLHALSSEQNPQVPPPLPPLASHCWRGSCSHLCAAEGCAHGARGVRPFCRTLGTAGQGVRTDGLREWAAPSPLCVSGLVSQSFPLCWEEWLLAGLFTPESTLSCLAMASLQLFPSVFSVPSCLYSAGPVVLLEAPRPAPPPLASWA